MRPFDRRGRLRASLLGMAMVACLALPVAASADTTGSPGGGTAQVTVGATVHVTAKLVAVVDVSFTCDPFLIYDWQTGTYVESTVGHLSDSGATLTQVQGRSIATGSAEFASGPDSTVVCDGVTVQTRSVTIMASTLPWKSGAAVVNAEVDVFSDGFEGRDLGFSGPVVVKLGK
jgi:hypothetical protein